MTYYIKPYLRKRGFNLSALAKTLGMSFQRFDHHIKKKDDLSLNFINELAVALDVPVDELILEIKVNDEQDENMVGDKDVKSVKRVKRGVKNETITQIAS
jgi:transcriptional regulator with XRE-family HTH domain